MLKSWIEMFLSYTAESIVKNYFNCPETIKNFQEITSESGVFTRRRQQQSKVWLNDLIKEKLETLFFQHPEIKPLLREMETAVSKGKIPATAAAQKLIEKFENRWHHEY